MRIPREKRFSPTQLTAFARCPRKYSFQYVERVPVERVPSRHLVFGNAVHAALDALYSMQPEDRSRELLEESFRNAWRDDPERHGAFSDPADEREWGLKGLELLERVASTGDFERATPRAVEDWVSVGIAGGRELFGRIDRIDDHPDGGVTVIDWKTGTCRIDEDGLGDQIQAQVYALATRATFGTEVAEVRFVFVEEQVERAWQPRDLDPVETRLVELVDEIDATSEFEARPDRDCGWCDFRHLCPAFS